MANIENRNRYSRTERYGWTENRDAPGSSMIKDKSFDFSEVWYLIKKRFVLLLAIMVIFSGGYAFARTFFDPPKYESTATIFLTPKFDEEGDLDQSSVSTNRTLLNNAIALMTRENIMTKVAQEVGDMTPDSIRDTLTVSAVSGTELISITSVTTDPQLSKTIVEATVNAFISTMQENLNLNNITVVDQPKLNFTSVSSSTLMYALQGAGIGLLIDVVLLIAWVTLDKRLKTKEAAEEYLGVPVFVVLPKIGK